MIELAKQALAFFCVFLITYLANYIYYCLKIKNKKINRNNMPTNIKYLVYKYKIDIVKLGISNIYKHLMLCDSIIVSILFIVTAFIKNIYLRLIVAFLLVFPLYVMIYHLIAMYYKKESEK